MVRYKQKIFRHMAKHSLKKRTITDNKNIKMKKINLKNFEEKHLIKKNQKKTVKLKKDHKKKKTH